MINLLRKFYYFIRRIFFSIKNKHLIHYNFFHRLDILRSVKASYTLGENQVDDTRLVKRIIKAYKYSITKDIGHKHTVWAEMNSYKQDVHDLLVEGNLEKVSNALKNPEKTDLFLGFDTLCRWRNINITDLLVKEQIALTMDGLVSCAEAIFARRLHNPVKSRSFEPKPKALDTEEILRELDKKFGFDISIPNPFPREYGVKSQRGIISFRVPQALYQAWRVKECLKKVSKSHRVMELGAGLGRTAYYAYLLGIKDYILVDLPLTNVAQAYFLGRTLGNENILLEGEENRDGVIAIKNPDSFIKKEDQYDVILNADGLTELDIKTAKDYWKEIEKRSTIFLSINHEYNVFTVDELIEEFGPYKEVRRFPSWMRRGYIENEIEF